ncbi:MAG: tetratricopeptide repeat protein [Sulfuritalea sp.]|nr:tetratricopeptide repeat protein [Sulfuritalea sp.]
MSLLLDALQRASLEKEKLAEQRAAAEKNPAPSETTLSAPVRSRSIELESDGLPRPSDVEPAKPVTAVGASSQPGPKQALPAELAADGHVESAVKTGELTLDPLHQTMPAASSSIGFAPFETAAPDVAVKPVVAEAGIERKLDQGPSPAAARVEPSLSPHAENEQPPASGSSAQKHSRPVASSQVAREILDATAKTSKPVSNRRLVILGGVALLFAAANGAFFLGYLDSILGLSSPRLGPVVSVSQVDAPLATTLETEAPPEGKKIAESPATVEGTTEAKVAGDIPTPSPTANSMQSSKSSPENVSPPSQPLKEGAGKGRPAEGKSASREARTPKIQPIFVTKPALPSELDTAYAALTSGRFEDAVAGYKQVLIKNPGERDAFLGLAYIAQRQGYREEARAYYQQVLRLQPGHPGASAGLLTLAAVGDLQLTASRAREMAERNPESAVALSTLAGLLAQEGRIAEAQQAYFKALALEPGSAFHAYNLAVALDRLHKYGPAQTYYQRALALAEKTGAGEQSGFPGKEAARRLAQLRARESEHNSLSANSASSNGQR